jgi:endo-1,4-beta-xylanase
MQGIAWFTLIASVCAADLPSLKALMPPGKHIGAALHFNNIGGSPASNDTLQYAAIQKAQFQMTQDKNCMNWAFVEYKQRGVWRWDPPDYFVAWANNNSQLVRGHALIWPAHIPAWVLNGNFSTTALRDAVNESLTTMVGRYANRVYAWHAVMEPFGDPHWKQVSVHYMLYRID